MDEPLGIHLRWSRIIDDLMNNRNVGYEQILEDIGFKSKEVWRRVDSNAIPTGPMLEKLVEKYGVDEQWLLEGEGRPYSMDNSVWGENMDSRLRSKVRLVLIDQIERKHLSNRILAQRLKRPEAYIRQCRNMSVDPDEAFVSRLAEEFDISPGWFHSNHGELLVFPGRTPIVADAAAGGAIGLDNIGKAIYLDKVARILQSGHSFAHSLVKIIDLYDDCNKAQDRNKTKYGELAVAMSRITKIEEALAAD